MTKLVDNAEVDVKIAIRDWCMDRLGGAANCKVLELYGGEGVMHDACYTDVAQHLAFDLKPITRKGWLCGDNRILWAKHHADGWNLIDADAYGIPWIVLLDVMKMIPKGEFAVAITDGEMRSLQTGAAHGYTRQVINYGGLPNCGLLAQWREDIVRWHINEWAKHNVHILNAVQGRSTQSKVHYFGLHCVKK